MQPDSSYMQGACCALYLLRSRDVRLWDVERPWPAGRLQQVIAMVRVHGTPSGGNLVGHLCHAPASLGMVMSPATGSRMFSGLRSR
jgi:hypothetical protein